MTRLKGMCLKCGMVIIHNRKRYCSRCLTLSKEFKEVLRWIDENYYDLTDKDKWILIDVISKRVIYYNLGKKIVPNND